MKQKEKEEAKRILPFFPSTIFNSKKKNPNYKPANVSP